MREVSHLVKEKNENAYPVYSSNSWEFNFYFRDAKYEVNSVDSLEKGKSNLSAFWLLQVGTPESDLLKFTNEFQVVENHVFYNSYALLIEKRKE
jgi:hypothetical protein